MKKNLQKRITETGDKVIQKSWIRQAARLGYVARGVIYLLLGILGMQLVLGWRTGSVNAIDALFAIKTQSFGKGLLLSVILGLLGYSLWGILRSIFNVTHEKNNIGGYANRLGYFVSAISTLFLAWTGIALFLDAPQSSFSTGFSGATQRVISIPFGQQFLIILGFFWVLVCIFQIVLAFQKKFINELIVKKKARNRQLISIFLGQTGFITRGVLWGLIGLLIFYAAWVADPSQALDMSQTLIRLNHQHFGQIVVSLISLGLISLGAFSFIQSRYLKFPQS